MTRGVREYRHMALKVIHQGALKLGQPGSERSLLVLKLKKLQQITSLHKYLSDHDSLDVAGKPFADKVEEFEKQALAEESALRAGEQWGMRRTAMADDRAMLIGIFAQKKEEALGSLSQT
ncbi:hypothetical protein NDU88_002196 [Pleurodeles waltl]|uniref:Uncharacterized protein n=1 Tax=Pleurodeles waltl TaxID=8319 RepID=A0AAV7Q6F0_PLEWA|nr:hypothetical protein NDU88_002196 [Pleurodeles waltl]